MTPNIPYSPEAVDIFKNYFPYMSTRDFTDQFFPEHSIKSVQHKARSLGIGKEIKTDFIARKRIQVNTILGHLTEAEKYYLAGIFDGEGCILFYKKRKHVPTMYVKVTITNTDKSLLNWLGNLFPETSRINYQSTNKSSNKAIYVWTIRGQNATKLFLKELFPYLIVKVPQAKLIIDYADGKITSKKVIEEMFRFKHQAIP